MDLEGILIPEIWIEVAKRFRVEALALTTRDVPDYDRLMRTRLKILRKEKIRLRDIQAVIRKMSPLPGAGTFLKKLRAQGPVVILSDTYYEFSLPFMEKLNQPALFCNWLGVDPKGYISGYVLRQKDGKRKAVVGFQKLGFKVSAVGDSFNDLTMLRAADRGVLFRPPASIRKANPRFPVANNYSTLRRILAAVS